MSESLYTTFGNEISYEIRRDKLVKFLEKKGIETRPMMGGCLPDQPAFQKSKMRVVGKLKNSRDIRDNVVFVGVHPMLKKRHFDHIINSFKIFFQKEVRS